MKMNSTIGVKTIVICLMLRTIFLHLNRSWGSSCDAYQDKIWSLSGRIQAFGIRIHGDGFSEFESGVGLTLNWCGVCVAWSGWIWMGGSFKCWKLWKREKLINQISIRYVNSDITLKIDNRHIVQTSTKKTCNFPMVTWWNLGWTILWMMGVVAI